MRPLSLLVIATSIAAADCKPTRAVQEAPSAPRVATRRFAAPLDTLWSIAFDDTAGAMPNSIATDGANVYVNDFATRTLAALDARTAALRWTYGGAHDSVVSRPIVVTARRAGGVFVFDAETRVAAALAPDGHVVARTPLPDFAELRSFCELTDGTLLVATPSGAHRIVRYSPNGRPAGAYPLPWPELETRPNLASVLLVAPTRDGCVAALQIASGFARFARDTFQTPTTFVEPFPPIVVRTNRRDIADGWIVTEEVAEHIGAALDVAATSREILIAFDGRSRDRAHLIDVYDIDGIYLRTYRTARRVEAIAATDSTLFVLTKFAGLPTLVALRLPPRR